MKNLDTLYSNIQDILGINYNHSYLSIILDNTQYQLFVHRTCEKLSITIYPMQDGIDNFKTNPTVIQIIINNRNSKIIGLISFIDHMTLIEFEVEKDMMPFDEFYDNMSDEGYMFNLSLKYDTTTLCKFLTTNKFNEVLKLIKEY